MVLAMGLSLGLSTFVHEWVEWVTEKYKLAVISGL